MKSRLLFGLLVLILVSVQVDCRKQRQTTRGQKESTQIQDIKLFFQKQDGQRLNELEANDYFQAIYQQYQPRWRELLDHKSQSNKIRAEIQVTLEKIDSPSDYQVPDVDQEYFEIQISETTEIKFHCVGYVSFLRALETFTGLISKEGTIKNLPISIKDQPSIAWRGLSIDTSRYFQSIEALRKIVQGMQITKLNIFHWHITDSESFPLQLLKLPNVTAKGAYSQSEIYTQSQIAEFIKYAQSRGVIVVPEIDQPAHTRSWALLPEYQELNACYDYPIEDWAKYCNQPPCGQLDPSLNKTYELAGTIIQEVESLFPGQYLHLGGDEVNYNCWDYNKKLKSWMTQKGISNYGELFNYYFSQLQKYIESNRTQIYWFNGQTGVKYSDSSIIQFWGGSNEYHLLKNYTNRVILSSYDYLYLDCGSGNILGNNSWCDPYKTWSRLYSFNPQSAQLGDRLFGVEAAVWTELIPEDTIDFKIWPRASALAMRLWNTEENLSRPKLVETLVKYNSDMLKLGIQVGPVSNEYCEKHIDMCFF